jgi:diguanylate cyclase (GGDEF)-like protein
MTSAGPIADCGGGDDRVACPGVPVLTPTRADALTFLFPWIWPGGLLVLVQIAIATWWPEASWLSEIAFPYTWVVLGAGALLASLFRRSRVVALCAILALLASVPPIETVDGADPLRAAGAMSLVALGILSLMGDRGVFSPLGLLQVGIAASLVGLGLFTAQSSPASWTWLDTLRAPGGFEPLAAPGIVFLWAGSTAVAALAAVRRSHPIERAFVGVALTLGMAVGVLPGAALASFHIGAAGLLLTLAIVETSYSLAYRDELTGLPTRRALWQTFDSVGGTYSVAMIDIDHFKRFNDRHGHDVGDQVLKMVASRLAQVSGGGKAFRYGGEEFTVVFPGKSRDQALEPLEELRERIAASRFSVRRTGRPRKKPNRGPKKSKRAPRQLSVKVSIGVAERTDKTRNPESVIKAADKALYRAKKAGRNRVAK